MAAAAAAAPGNNVNANPGRGWSLGSNVLFYVIISVLLSNVFLPKLAAEPPAQDFKDTHGAAAPSVTTPAALKPYARRGERFSIVVETEPSLFAPLHFDKLFFDHEALKSANLNVSLPVDLKPCFESNCSVELHVTWSVRDVSLSASVPLVRFFKDTTVRKKYLFGNHSTEDSDAEADEGKYAAFKAFFQPEVTLSPVVSFDNPLPVPYLDFTPSIDEKPGFYGPALYINNFWMLREHYVELNASTVAQPLSFRVQVVPAPLWKVMLYTQFEKSMSSQASLGLSRQSEAEETKRMLLEVSTKNPILLAVTAIVTALHTVFEFLAFSNDVQFWRGKKDFRGLSVRSIAINCYFQTIIFLYLLDSSSETSWAVLVPSGLCALMEYWKLAKTLNISKAEPQSEDAGETQQNKGGLRIAGYVIRFNASYDSRTQKHDDVAVRYLIYAMIPLLVGNAIYSAVYKTHRNWYSFLISTQVQFIYSFGFAQMTPQIFINYKMKSVGQLPWRTFIYKSLNTVIDDLFSFVIKMPWLHRLACFQDDVVFAILLYQRWIYPVDMSRFDGDSGADKDDEVEKKAKIADDEKTESSTPKEIEAPETKKNQ